MGADGKGRARPTELRFIKRVLGRIGRDRPLLMWLDDLHYATQNTFDACAPAPDLPLLIIVTARSETLATDLDAAAPLGPQGLHPERGVEVGRERLAARCHDDEERQIGRVPPQAREDVERVLRRVVQIVEPHEKRPIAADLKLEDALRSR